ncbi:hypothetical protein K469DRAFT_755533 [Zopfia rhizophila CBS 207.26]|uniref:Uncharacterized protein n=1 Tax=Zopfia rhizophila CBS 207.26 TaxID=1314779 RepID=A0A6A6DB53_9PEZI|nr:hypothetical protein K469DRAFT_755533 [Zopfia rhizophila CBS 207.26]
MMSPKDGIPDGEHPRDGGNREDPPLGTGSGHTLNIKESPKHIDNLVLIRFVSEFGIHSFNTKFTNNFYTMARSCAPFSTFFFIPVVFKSRCWRRCAIGGTTLAVFESRQSISSRANEAQQNRTNHKPTISISSISLGAGCVFSGQYKRRSHTLSLSSSTRRTGGRFLSPIDDDPVGASRPADQPKEA